MAKASSPHVIYLPDRMRLLPWFVYFLYLTVIVTNITKWYSSGTTFSEYAAGGHYKMSKADKRENIIMVRVSSSMAYHS